MSLHDVTIFRKKRYAVLLASTSALWAAVLVSGSSRSTPSIADRPDGFSEAMSLAEPHAVVLKSRRILHLFDGEVLVRSYPLVLGTSPTGIKSRAGDGRTPEGVFRVCSKKRSSPHHRFLGINYPSAEDARRGLALGVLTSGEAAAIIQAAQEQRCPPWTTPLGGGIGLHGQGSLGQGLSTDWTAGCIALTDEHIDELFAVLRAGDRVEILP